MTTHTAPNRPNTAIPTLVLSKEAHKRLMDYVLAVTSEISGFADCTYLEDTNMIYVDNVYLLRQEAGGADVEIDEEAVAELMEDLISQGRTQMPQVWWHSHANMGTFFSGTDDETMCELKNDSFMVSLVANRSGSMKAVLNLWKPIALTLDMKIEVEEATTEIPAEIMQEVADKVREKKYTYTPPEKKKDEKGKIYLPSAVHGSGATITRNLPKDPIEAQAIIDKKQLIRSWDWHSNMYYWFDMDENCDYIDIWGTMNEQIRENAKRNLDMEDGSLGDDMDRWGGYD